MRLQKIIFTLLTLSVFMPATAANLSDHVLPILKKEIGTSTFAMVVKDADTGKTLFDYQSQKVLTPASNVKLFSAAAALYGLGLDYQYHTLLKAQFAENDASHIEKLSMEFSGDPSLTENDVVEMIHQLQERHITRIDDIIVEAKPFKGPDYPGGISYEDLAYYFAAPVNSIILDGNAIDLTLISGMKKGDPVKIELNEADRWLPVTQDVRTVLPSAYGEECDLNITVKPQNQIHLHGCIAQSDKPRHEWIALSDPFAKLKFVLTSALLNNQIAFSGTITEGKADGVVLADHASQPLTTLVTHMLKRSDNLYADAFIKTLGHVNSGQGSFFSGTKAMQSILTQHTKVNFSNMNLSDGSGTRFNLISPATITQLLQDVYHDPNLSTQFIAALPIAGVDGTLTQRFANNAAREKVFAKTGSMHDVSSMSGFIHTKKKHTLLFSMISNNVLGGTDKTKKLEEKLCSILYLKG